MIMIRTASFVRFWPETYLFGSTLVGGSVNRKTHLHRAVINRWPPLSPSLQKDSPMSTLVYTPFNSSQLIYDFGRWRKFDFIQLPVTFTSQKGLLYLWTSSTWPRRDDLQVRPLRTRWHDPEAFPPAPFSLIWPNSRNWNIVIMTFFLQGALRWRYHFWEIFYFLKKNKQKGGTRESILIKCQTLVGENKNVGNFIFFQRYGSDGLLYLNIDVDQSPLQCQDFFRK